MKRLEFGLTFTPLDWSLYGFAFCEHGIHSWHLIVGPFTFYTRWGF